MWADEVGLPYSHVKYLKAKKRKSFKLHFYRLIFYPPSVGKEIRNKTHELK